MKITKLVVKYPTGLKPTRNLTNPSVYTYFRYSVGHNGSKPLVCIGMNPSAAREEYSDRTVNKVIKHAVNNGYDGWIMLNIYPERATNIKDASKFNIDLHKQNLSHIVNIVKSFNVKEIWCAWGDGEKNMQDFEVAKNEIIKELKRLNVKLFHFERLTKLGNPRHPLYLKIDWNKKNYDL